MLFVILERFKNGVPYYNRGKIKRLGTDKRCSPSIAKSNGSGRGLVIALDGVVVREEEGV